MSQGILRAHKVMKTPRTSKVYSRKKTVEVKLSKKLSFKQKKNEKLDSNKITSPRVNLLNFKESLNMEILSLNLQSLPLQKFLGIEG